MHMAIYNYNKIGLILTQIFEMYKNKLYYS